MSSPTGNADQTSNRVYIKSDEHGWLPAKLLSHGDADAADMEDIGEENRFMKKTLAINTIFDKLDHSICATCERRIFRECESIPAPSGDPGKAANNSDQ